VGPRAGLDSVAGRKIPSPCRDSNPPDRRAVAIPIELSRLLNMTVPVVLYGCETLSFTLRERHRQRVSENGLLRKIFGPKWEELAGGWRRLHSEELHKLYSSVI
jgi:hypothetical protein